MKFSVSNIAWGDEYNDAVYAYLSKKHFNGIEIAPTRLFPDAPYTHIREAVDYFDGVKTAYGLEVSSMQSIWYGQGGNIFHAPSERDALRDYTFAAVDFASAIGCHNLVFGCPKARHNERHCPEQEVYPFFQSISAYAHERNTCIALEPNPVIYGTNFINTTPQAFDFCRASGCEYLRVNVDLGTILYNNEAFDCVQEHMALVNHIHISEPYLKKIEKRDLHRRIKALDFAGYVSIEMGRQEDINDVFDVIDYTAEVFEL